MTSRLRSKHILLTILVLFQVLSISLYAQTTSVLANGEWVKMSFEKSGVYKIDQTTLSAMGFNIGNLNPKNIAIYGNKGGMLPQAISENRAQDLTENSIFVSGEQDGVFNSQDYILFYVDRVDELKYNSDEEDFDIINNLYSDEINYFITLRAMPGARLNLLPNLGLNFPEIRDYNLIIGHELDVANILSSGREWYGEQFGSSNELVFNFTSLNIAPNRPIKVTLNGMVQAFSATSYSATINNHDLGLLDFSAISNTRYGIKGDESSGRFSVNSDLLANNSEVNLKINFNREGINNTVGYLNRFSLSIPSRLRYDNQSIHSISVSSLNQNISTYKIENGNTNLRVWDVTDPLNPQLQSYDLVDSEVQFGAFSDTLREYVIFDTSILSAPDKFERISNQDLHGQSTPVMVIISAPQFIDEARRLAGFRQSQDNLSILVVTPQEIYNEFSAGRQDITAVRDFMRYLKSQDDKLQYLLLFGKGSYDYKDRVEQNSNFVPTYESRSALNPLTTYSSDDYFGFLEDNEGLWIENTSGDHSLDIGIGRIPSTTLAQAKTTVDKIIRYQNAAESIGDWRRRLVFIADDGDNNLHQRDADRLATLVDTTYAGFNVSKLYLDTFKQNANPNGESSPDAEKALLDAVEQGALIMNFTGHGAETGWTQERILTTTSIDYWKNKYRLPLLVTATCEFGRNDDPTIFSGAEKILFKEDGGSIALVTTARPVFSSSNYSLNLALYQTILEQPNGNFQRLGDIIRFTKNNALNGANNRNFILLGDPSMRLAYPKNGINLTGINGNTFNTNSDTLRALSKVRIEGQIERGNQLADNFNGEVNFILFDKRSQRQTLGSDSEKFQYLERDSQLFNGRSTVKNGLFAVEFVVPKNIDYRFGLGKISMYASDQNLKEDAFGANIDFILGGSSRSNLADNQPPIIRSFINDTTRVIKAVVKGNANLVLKLFDESGINISENGIGQNLSATLNDSVTYNLNSFYNAQKDSFKKGEVLFPMRGLPIGINRIAIRAWDNHNNLAKATLEFEVTSRNSILITEINNHPNPLVYGTTFSISHNSASEPLELTIEIINTQGEKLTSLYSEISEGSNTERISWNGMDKFSAKLSKGIYIYSVTLTSKNSGKTHTKRKKLIISY